MGASPALVTLDIDQSFCVTGSMEFIYKSCLLSSGGWVTGLESLNFPGLECALSRLLFEAVSVSSALRKKKKKKTFNNDCSQILHKRAVLVDWSAVTNSTIRNMMSHSLET